MKTKLQKLAFALVGLFTSISSLSIAQTSHWGIEEHTVVKLVPAAEFSCLGGVNGAMDPTPPPTSLTFKKNADGTFAMSYFGAGYYGIHKLDIADRLTCQADPKDKFIITCLGDGGASMVSTRIDSTTKVETVHGPVRITTRQLKWDAWTPSIQSLPHDQQHSILKREIPGFDLQQGQCK